MDVLAATINFIDAWNRRDRAAIVDAIHEDAVCIGIPLPPAHGRDAAMALFDPLLGAEEIDWRILHISASGNVVLTERLDRFRFAGRDWTEIRVMGVFEYDDELRIVAQRDYFDLGEMTEALGHLYG